MDAYLVLKIFVCLFVYKFLYNRIFVKLIDNNIMNSFRKNLLFGSFKLFFYVIYID